MFKNRVNLLLVFALLAALLLSLTAATTEAADTSWQAQYWNNRSLSGTPVVTRSEANIDYNWGHGSPVTGVNVDDFSARWTRTFNWAAGLYRFQATVDDGVRIWVDGTPVIDAWYDSATHTVTGDIYLSAGDHAVKVEYYEAGGDAVAKVSWTFYPPQPGVYYNWKGEYYNNMTLSGSPTVVRDDQAIDFDWGGGAPATGLSGDKFSVRWTRSVTFSPGRYRFQIAADDGVRLWVNGQLLIDRWFDQQAAWFTADIDLTGTVPIQVEYYENTGGAEVSLSWGYVGSATFVNNWKGEYFNNTGLTGSPALVRDDGDINFNWGNGAPASGLNADNFSVRWTRTLSLNAGRYRFTATTDDGVRVWVNGQLIIENWSDHAAQTVSGEINLTGGSVPVKMEFYERSGQAQAALSWARLSDIPPAPPPTPPLSAGSAIVTVADFLNVRSGPGVSYSVLTQVYPAQVMQLTGYRNSATTWVEIITPTSVRGWVNASYLWSTTSFSTLTVWTDPATSTAPYAIVTTHYLNVRNGPGVEYARFATVSMGTKVTLTGYRNSDASWVQVKLADGRIGWCSSRYLSGSVSFTTLTVWTG